MLLKFPETVVKTHVLLCGMIFVVVIVEYHSERNNTWVLTTALIPSRNNSSSCKEDLRSSLQDREKLLFLLGISALKIINIS